MLSFGYDLGIRTLSIDGWHQCALLVIIVVVIVWAAITAHLSFRLLQQDLSDSLPWNYYLWNKRLFDVDDQRRGLIGLHDEDLVAHEVTEAILVPIGLHCWDELLVLFHYHSLEEILHVLFWVEGLQIVDDSQMIDEFATLTEVLVRRFLILNHLLLLSYYF